MKKLSGLLTLSLFLAVSAFAQTSLVTSSSTVALNEDSSAQTTVDPESFTIIALPDTQYYSLSDEAISFFEAQTNWIVDNLETQRIAFVSHEGDLVENGYLRDQWARVDQAMDTLDGLVPYSAPPGNHDYDEAVNVRSVGAAKYLDYFGPERYVGYSWYGGAAPNGLSHYQLFEAGGYVFLHLGLEWAAPGPASDASTPLGWANSILQRYPDTPTIITTHAYLWNLPGLEGHEPVTDAWDSSTGLVLFEQLVKPNAQVFMVLCGHYSEGTPPHEGEWHQVSTNDAGLAVYELLANYQDYPNGGNGWLRLIEFLPGGGADGLDRISVKTYSPVLDAYRTEKYSEFFFDLEFDERFGVEAWESAAYTMLDPYADVARFYYALR